MPLDADSLTWSGLTIGRKLSDTALLGDEIQGFGHGVHKVTRLDRLMGGQSFGTSTRGALSLEVDAWAPVSSMGALRASMAPMTDPATVGELRWKGLGWDPTVELAVWAKPLGFDFDVDEDAVPLAAQPGYVTGIRLAWVAGDPHVYAADATTRTEASPVSSASWAWTNPGPVTPSVGMGGRAWTVTITAATSVVHPFVQNGSQTVTFTGTTLTAGQVLSIGADRIPTVDGDPVVGYSGGVPQPDWPRFAAGVASTFAIGATSGTFTASGEFRGVYG